MIIINNIDELKKNNLDSNIDESKNIINKLENNSYHENFQNEINVDF